MTPDQPQGTCPAKPEGRSGKKRSRGMCVVWASGVALLLAMCGWGLAIWWLTSLDEVFLHRADCFFRLASAGDYEQARRLHCDESLRAKYSAEEMRKVFLGVSLATYSGVRRGEWRLTRWDAVKWKGAVMGGGQEHPIALEFVREKGDWKILSLEFD